MGRQYNRLSLKDRIIIKDRLDNGISIRKIGKELGYAHGSIFAEIKRGLKDGQLTGYDPYYADLHSRQARENKGRIAIFQRNAKMATLVSKMILEEKMSVLKVADRLTTIKDAKCQSVSINTIYHAIDQGLIPGVTRASLQSEETKMFSDGLIHIPQNVRERFGFRDGDVFKLVVSEDGKITIKKVAKDGTYDILT